MSFGSATQEDLLQQTLLGLGFEPKAERVGEEDEKRSKVLVLAGPTGCGKTELSLMLAKTLSGEVISADSMQFYKGMDVGTAKATLEEQKEVPHHLVDIVDLRTSMNVVDFYHEAKKACESILSRNRVPIVVGGSGFYIRTLLYGPPSGPSSVPEIREEIEGDLEIHGCQALYERLQELDSEYAAKITSNDRVKIVRALEIIALTGKKVSDHSWGNRDQTLNYDFHCWFLYRPRESLYLRIDQRCEQMIADGLIEEVKTLRKQGLEENLSAAQSIGYRQTIEFLKTEQTEEDYAEYLSRFQQASRRYAKRQITWFRNEPLFRWLDIELHDPEIAVDIIAQDYQAW